MPFLYLAGGVVSFLLCGYLVVAMLNPERF